MDSAAHAPCFSAISNGILWLSAAHKTASGFPAVQSAEALLLSFYTSLSQLFSGAFDGTFSLKTFGVSEKSFIPGASTAKIRA